MASLSYVGNALQILNCSIIVTQCFFARSKKELGRKWWIKMKNPTERGTCYLGTREYKMVYQSTEKRPNTLYHDNETISCDFIIHGKNLLIEV